MTRMNGISNPHEIGEHDNKCESNKSRQEASTRPG